MPRRRHTAYIHILERIQYEDTQIRTQSYMAVCGWAWGHKVGHQQILMLFYFDAGLYLIMENESTGWDLFVGFATLVGGAHALVAGVPLLLPAQHRCEYPT